MRVARLFAAIASTAVALLTILYFANVFGPTVNSPGQRPPASTMVAMPDGLKLHTRVWKPPQQGRFPTVLTRGYSPGNPADALRFNDAGYVYVGQSTRGHGESEGDRGVRNRFFDDADDGYDTLTWIGEQPWSNGEIAMYGKSYWAATQWLVAIRQHPNLKAIVPQNMNADLWQCVYWCNGALSLAMTARGRAYDRDDVPAIDKIGWVEYFRHLPLLTLDEVIDGSGVPGAAGLWRDYVEHSTFDDYWRAISIRADGKDGKYRQIAIPVYLMGGWYDYYAGAAFTSYERLREVGATDEIRVVVNPSDHLNAIPGDRDFGPGAEKDEVALAIRWLDHVVRGIDNGVDGEAPVRIFVMGINRWRDEYEWPLARTRFTKYYFHGSGGATRGSLNTEPPRREPPTTYLYDPDDPVPTLGGNHSFSDKYIPGVIRAGAVDQTPNEGRSDVLVFTTTELAQDTEVTGPVSIRLFAASSATDTDFTAKLIDVYPDGRAYNLTEGIVRARFRQSVWEPPRLLTPGEIYEYNLQLLPTSNVFRKGHRIRVHLTSSNFPLWNRNLNTGERQGYGSEQQVAKQTIYHDERYPSHMILPIVPTDHGDRTR